MTTSDSATPLVWHYGLMAELWAEFSNDTPELPFFERTIARFGQPVLDVACGTGRLLRPLLAQGIDIDGCDISADMLAHCTRLAARTGLRAQLYAQPMHTFALPRHYQTIYMCGAFGLAGSRALDYDALRRCYAHLAPGGALVFNVDAEYTAPTAWNLWLPTGRATLPAPWPAEGRRQVASDGSELISRFRMLALDPLEQSYARQVRLEKWRGGTLVAQEEYTLHGQMYFKNEVLDMLAAVGFHDISVTGEYTDAPATAEHTELIFIARR